VWISWAKANFLSHCASEILAEAGLDFERRVFSPPTRQIIAQQFVNAPLGLLRGLWVRDHAM
jgi:hypothetical protein